MHQSYNGKLATDPSTDCTHFVTGRSAMARAMAMPFRFRAKSGTWSDLIKRFPDAAPSSSGRAARGAPRAVSLEHVWQVKGRMIDEVLTADMSK